MTRGQAVAVIGLALAAAGAAQAFGASTVKVDIKDFAFAPVALRISPGTTVTWTNHDEETHTITSTTGVFGSTGLGSEEMFARQFDRAGTYEYFCALHPKMRATVIVR